MYKCYRMLGIAALALVAWSAQAQDSACPDRDPQRRAFFGDLHIHTALSADAFVMSTRNRPDDAYRFARGEEISIRALMPGATREYEVRIPRPLDFAAVTDHIHVDFYGIVEEVIQQDG